MNKTVYFLGAGFSKPAGGPIQNEIIQTILSPDFKNKYSDNNHIKKALEKFTAFLRNDLHIKKENYAHVELEDIFTPIDRCLADSKSFGNYGNKALAALREDLHLLTAAAIQFRIDQPGNNSDYIAEFALYLDKIAQSRMLDNKDKIAVITTNWDILLDNNLQEAINDNGIDALAVVDYCCYISSLEDNPNIKPGLFALGKGGYNIKILKLHGSTNWLHCPMCQRMYVIFNKKPMLDKPFYCSHCKTNYKIDRDRVSIQLRGNLLVPTFLKDLSNIQIKLVWQNAGIELNEASKIVFIGYSLPAADFEIRQLLSRSIPKETSIDVVVYPREKKKKELKKRYNNFFGNRHLTFIEKDVTDYIHSICHPIE